MISALSHPKHMSEAVNSEDDDSRIYFAAGKSAEVSRPNLAWVARNFLGKKICFLHVLKPSPLIPSENTTLDNENKLTQGILKKYLLLSTDVGLEGEEMYIESENVEEGIVKLISDLGIKNLVMGAAAREMVYIESKITEYVIKNGAAPCQIWFLHKGHLIKTRYEQVLNEEVCISSTKEIHEESLRYEKTAKESVEAAWEEKANEKMYTEEMQRRKEIEDALFINKQELENMNNQLVAVTKERNSALWENSFLEIKIADLEKKAEIFQEKLISAVELLQSYKKQRDDLQLELDRAVRANEELSLQAANSNLIGNLPPFVSEVSYSEIEDATQGFHPSSKIGEEGSHIFKGVLRGTEVMIKVLYADSSQGYSEYQKEVEVLSRLRHPNIVGLIGTCTEAYAIIHEYLPNGSLEDRLSCKDNTPPLTWQVRFRIAAELCSALIFLHSTKPHPIVHGDLKPSNILLDANFVSKLSNFGTCHVISPDQINKAWSAGSRRILPKGTFAYLDPEFRTAVEPELSPQLDIYSFGLILLKLLTAREAWGIGNEVQHAFRTGKLNSLLDSSAGDWPYLQTRQLTHIALRCADESRKNRPNLESEVRIVLESIRASCLGIPLAPRLGVDRHSQAPSYFVCPISQDIMQDPHVAADGFTYELEGIQGWLLSGHNTSPMTNLKLAHTKLVPNRALRSAIQEWLKHY